MKTIKPQKLGVLTRVFEADRRSYLAVGMFLFVPLDATRNALAEVEMWKTLAKELGEGGVLDEGWSKPGSEVLVTGKCFSPGGTRRPQSYVRVRLGKVQKKLAVFGDRIWKGSTASTPVPFADMPIDRAHAFGGEGYAPNPKGRGAGRPKGSEDHPLPNVELTDHLVTSPKDRPPVAGFGPIPVDSPERREKAGTYDRQWQREQSPGFPKDLDPTFFHTAPADQRFAAYLAGDEPFEIENMHPTKPLLEGRLPGYVARAFVNQKRAGGEELRPIATRLETVHFFPTVERAVLVFRGVIDVAEDDAADVLQLMIACEDPASPRSTEHYANVLAMRLDRRKAVIAALRDGDLMPAMPNGAKPSKNDVAEQLQRENLLEKNLRRRREDEISTMLAGLAAQGISPAAAGVVVAPAEEPPGVDDPDALAEYLEKHQTAADEQRVAAEARRAEQESALRAACERNGTDYDETVKAASGGPPKFSAKAELAKVPPAVRAADPSLEEKLAQAEQNVHLAYRRGAHVQPPAPALDAAEAARRGAALADAVERGESVAGRDFTGADLSKRSLAGKSLRGAFLENANLAGADLSDADLSDVVLARANLTAAKFVGANLAGANLGGAGAIDADFSRAELAKAVLAKARLESARFDGATLDGVDFSETEFGTADLRGIRAESLQVLKSDLSKAKLAGAKLKKCFFVECDFSGVDLQGAELAQVSFVTCRGAGAVFRGATLGRSVFVKECAFPDADFREAKLDESNLRGTILDRARMDGASLRGADLSECSLKGASLAGASAPGALFMKTDLTKAKLVGVNLMDAILQKANLLGADLSRANLFRADVSRARLDASTKLDGALQKNVRLEPRSTDAKR